MSTSKTDKLMSTILEAMERYITEEIDLFLAGKKEEIEQRIDEIRVAAVTKAGIQLAKYVDYQQMSDHIVIRIQKEKQADE